jgi:hypothetical protein
MKNNTNSDKNLLHKLIVNKIYFKYSNSDYNFNFMQTFLVLPFLILISLIDRTYEL